MKKIEAIVRQKKFQDVCMALESSGIGGLTMTPAQRYLNR